MIIRSNQTHATRRGGALISSLIVVVTLSTLVASLFMVNITHQREVAGIQNRSRALYLAEMGISQCLLLLAGADERGEAPPATHGTAGVPNVVRGGNYWCDIVDNLDGTFTVTSTGSTNLVNRTVSAVVAALPSAFDHAIFAGISHACAPEHMRGAFSEPRRPHNR